MSTLPAWIRSHLPNDFPFAVPDSEDVRRSIKQIHSPVLPPQLLSQAGQALISILSMVTGLLLSYKSSSALGKWEKGKGVWIGAGAGSGGMSGGLRGEVRSAVRMISLIHNEIEEEEDDLQTLETQADDPTGAAESVKQARLHQRAGELVSLLVGFAFALHYHLAHIRTPLYKPPLSDLLPAEYLSTLRRTDGRVRFEENGYDDQTLYKNDPARSGKSGAKGKRGDESPGQKVRISPRSRSRSLPRPRSRVRLPRSANSVESLDSDSRPQSNGQTSERASDGLPTQTHDGPPENRAQQAEWTRQFRQLNVPIDSPAVISGTLHTGDDMFQAGTDGDVGTQEEVGVEGEHSANELNVTDRLAEGSAESLSPATKRSSAPKHPPPLSLSIHLTHLLLLYLLAIPAQLMPVLGKWTVPVALVAGWGLLGVEALSREVGAVFGTSENHIPTYLYCAEMLSETLDISPLFLGTYSSRVRDRLESDEDLAGRLDELIHKGDPRVLVLTRLSKSKSGWSASFSFKTCLSTLRFSWAPGFQLCAPLNDSTPAHIMVDRQADHRPSLSSGANASASSSLSTIGSSATPAYNPPPSRLPPPKDMIVDSSTTAHNRYPPVEQQNHPLNTKDTGLTISTDSTPWDYGDDSRNEHDLGKRLFSAIEQEEMNGRMTPASMDGSTDADIVKPYAAKRGSNSRFALEDPMEVDPSRTRRQDGHML
ncbi:hypothetical protein QFC22_002726 [Naganishia vaughanmartiniae]|uniref:Uncharacterized protein n=1 Tax=Naganishia vaughanmartiniae TaxID=1424756 RepID=A0ACC2XBY7_9TREE|nr:hypothetical protein QFC22_002726 [Naganishia vaughanmartiniae]